MTDKKLWKAFSLYIRLRDTDSEGFGSCFTCPRILHYTKGDCGHGIGRQHKATKYNEKNNHLQCKPCNGFNGGMREVYKQQMNLRYGDYAWDLMELASKTASKWSQFEIDILEKHYKNLVIKLNKF
jgi:hypothetical protein